MLIKIMHNQNVKFYRNLDEDNVVCVHSTKCYFYKAYWYIQVWYRNRQLSNVNVKHFNF